MNSINFVGQIIDKRFEILQLAGSGGMGTVFQAKQLELDRLVALKLLDPAVSSDEEFKARFLKEAQVLSRLQSVHIAAFYAFGFHENKIPYLAMEYIEAESLLAIIARQGKLEFKRALNLTKQICQALSHAHELGIVHRDLKPANILVLDKPEADFVKVIDFGLAKLNTLQDQVHSENKLKLTRTGELLGSPLYMSPEQCQGQKVDQRSDIYAVGCLLYEMLTGSAPFQADNPVAVIHKQIHQAVPQLANSKDLPAPELNQILLNCLAKEAGNRYQSAQQIDDDLSRLLAGQPLEKIAAVTKSSLASAAVQKRLWSLAALSALIIFVAAAAYLFTDAGIVLRAEFDLAFASNKAEQAVKWLANADRLEIEAKKKDAAQICQCIEQALNLSSGGAKQRVEICLKLSEEAAAIGAKAMALKYALKAIQTTDSLVSSQRLSKTETAVYYDRAAKILVDQNLPLNKLQVLALTRNMQLNFDALSQARCTYVLDLFAHALANRQILPSPGLVQIMDARLKIIADPYDIEKTKEALESTVKALKECRNISSEAEPRAYAFIANEIASTHKEFASSCADKAKSILLSEKFPAISETNKGNYPEYMSHLFLILAEAYRKLENSAEAEACFRNALETAVNAEARMRSQQQYASFLAGQKRPDEARAMAQNTMKELEIFRQKELIPVVSRVTVENLAGIYRVLNENDKAQALLQQELDLEKERLPEGLENYSVFYKRMILENPNLSNKEKLAALEDLMKMLRQANCIPEILDTQNHIISLEANDPEPKRLIQNLLDFFQKTEPGYVAANIRSYYETLAKALNKIDPQLKDDRSAIASCIAATAECAIKRNQLESARVCLRLLEDCHAEKKLADLRHFANKYLSARDAEHVLEVLEAAQTK